MNLNKNAMASKKLSTPIAMLVLILGATTALADPPDLQTGGPIIHLADNLDEKDNLGWCIDTLGRGQSELLQAHSCKPQQQNSEANADVKFEYDESSYEIKSASYENQCMTLLDASADVRFGLQDCTGGAEQQFAYDQDNGSISPNGQSNQCVAVGGASSSAGPFMSRSLILADCETTDASLRTWKILEE